jgi:hypothetical protein
MTRAQALRLAELGLILLGTGFLTILGAVILSASPTKVITVIGYLTLIISFFLGLGWGLSLYTGRPAYRTTHHIQVTVGRNFRPTRAEIEQWTSECLTLWMKARWTSDLVLHLDPVFPTQRVLQHFQGIRVFCCDRPLSMIGHIIRGYYLYPSIILTPENASHQFKHQLSHILLTACGVLRDEREHHRIFKEVGLA